MAFQHKTLAAGRWFELSIMEQLGNVGGEIHRALMWKDKNKEACRRALNRALELMDFTISDERWRAYPGRLKELVRAREVIGDAMYGGKEYGSTLEDLDRYFFLFALGARLKK